jgi:hypothetical protein
MPAIAAMAAMALMAAMAAVMSSTGIRDFGNRTIRRQDKFRTSTESSLAGVWVSIVSKPSEDIVSTPSEELVSTPSEELGSTPSRVRGSTPSDEFESTSECVRSDFVTGQPVAKPTRSTYSMVFG